MQEQKKGSKKLLWVLIAAIIVLAAAAAVLIGLIAGNLSGNGTTAPTGNETVASTGGEATEPTQAQLVRDTRLFWNLDREKYIAKGLDGTSGRTIKSDGYFHIDFAVDGQRVEYLTADDKLVDYIEMQEVMGLVFDENGVIVDLLSIEECGYVLLTRQVFVTSVEGNNIVGNNAGNLKGVDLKFRIDDNTGIYDVGSGGPLNGLPCQIEIDDDVMVIGDETGRAVYVFVRPYKEPGDVYWNVDRQYDSTQGVTTRKADKDGGYTFVFALNGELVTLRTRDQETASAVDKVNAPAMTLTFDDEGYIIDVGSFRAATNGSTWSSWCDVTAIDGKKVTTERVLSGTNQGTVYENVMTDNCKIIDVSGMDGEKGDYTDLRVGDRVQCLTDARGRVCYVFIVSRPIECPIYWNVERMYSDTTKQTTRQREYDGYYHILMTANGRQITVKTDDKAIATKIDASSARQFALTLKDGNVIDKIYSTTSVKGYEGGSKSMSWVDVTSVSGRTIKAQKNQSGHADDGKVFTTTMASDCKVYNVCDGGVVSYIGEPASVRVGDRIHVHHNKDGEATLIFIVSGRTVLNKAAKSCPCAKNVTWQPWDGTTELQNNGYYYLTADVTAPAEGFIIESKTVYLRLDGHTISSEGRCFYVKASGKLNICDHETRGKLIGSGVEGESGGVIRVYTPSGVDVNLWNIDVEFNSESTVAPKEGGLLSVSGAVSAYNVNFRGGYSTSSAGAIRINASGTFRAFDCTFTGGTTKGSGGNINCNGAMYLKDCTIADGVAGGSGDNIYFSTSKECAIENVTMNHTDPTAQNLYMGSGVLDVSGVINISSDIKHNVYMNGTATMNDLGLKASSVIGLTREIEGNVLTNAASDLRDVFVEKGCEDLEEIYDASAKKIWLKSTLVAVEHTGEHCLCAGQKINALAGHTCTTLTGWKELTADVLTASSASSSRLMFKEDGSYYLTVKKNFGKVIDIMPGQNITICLNGCELTNGANQVFVVAGKLTITDCRGTGTVVGNGTANGGCVKLVNGGKLDLYGGTLTNASTASQGAVVVISSDQGGIAPSSKDDGYLGSVFTMYGGAVTGGTATAEGGNINIWHQENVFRMYGGTVSGGKAGTTGGNISLKGDSDTTSCVVELLGGTVTGGTCDKGAGICVGNGTFILGGNAKVTGNNGEDIMLSAGRTITIHEGGYSGTDTDTMTLDAGVGVFATNVPSSGIGDLFKVGDRNSVVYSAEEKTLSIVGDSHKDHCVCADKTLNTLANHTCNVLTGWIPVTADVFEDAVGTDGKVKGVKFKESGNYCLSGNFTLSALLNIMPDQEITLCLHGYKLSRAGQVAVVAGKLSVTDCIGTGVVQAASTSYGGCLKTLAGGTIDLYAGTLKNSSTVTYGGGVVILSRDKGNGLLASDTAATAFNMYGGTITGGTDKTFVNSSDKTVNCFGGNVSIMHSNCTFTMYGGTIEKGKSEYAGGNISSRTGSSEIILLGGTITGGKAGNDKDNDVYVYSGTKLTLGGNVQIGWLDLNGSTVEIHDSGLTTEKPITIVAGEGVFATNANEEDLKDRFVSADDTLHVLHDEYNKTLLLSTETAMPEPEHLHCVCGGLTAEDHTCEDKSWTAWDGTELTLSAGLYYLTQDVTITDTAMVNGISITGEVYLCLNDHTIASQVGRVFNITGSGKLTLCGHKDGGADTVIGAGINGNGGVIRGGNDTTELVTYGVTLKYAEESEIITSEGGVIASCGVVKLYNTTVTGGAAKKGGNISVYYTLNSTAGRLYMYDCTVTGGEATESVGGNILAAVPTVMERCAITDGKAAGSGDNLITNRDVEFVLTACTITNSLTGEGSIYYNLGTLTLSGKTTISGDAYGIYVPSGKKLVLNDLNVESRIGLTMAEYGIFAEGVEDKTLTACFTDDAQVRETFYDEQSKVLSLGALNVHSHCFCTADTKGLIKDHVCDQNIVWLPITDEVFEEAVGTDGTTVKGIKFKTDGYYYLAGDYTLSNLLNIMPGQNISICLNGHTLSRAGQTIVCAGTLNITDCDGNAKGAVSASTTSYGGAVKVITGGTVNQFAGTLTNAKAVTGANGGVVAVNMDKSGIVEDTVTTPSAYKMYGGTITGGQTGNGKSGGNVAIWKTGCTFTMYGGKISNGTSVADAGNIAVGDGGSAVLLGGTITGGSAATNGDDVRFAGGTLTIGNDVKIGEIYVAEGKLITLQDLNTAEKILIKTSGAYAFAGGTEDDVEFFGASQSDVYSVEFKEGQLCIVQDIKPHNHCVCGGAAVGVGDHTECGSVSWQPWGLTDAEKSSLPTSGSYYLVDNIQLTAQFKGFNVDGNVSLCLNGYKITGTTRLIGVGGTLNITDCEFTKENDEYTFKGGIIGSANKQNGLVFYTYGGSALNIYGGRFESTATNGEDKSGGVIAVSKEAYKTGATQTPSIVTFYNGLITGGKAKNGGNIAIMNGATFTMYGGIIENGSATNNGGNISVGNNCYLNLLGGEVRNAKTFGTACDIYSNGVTVIGGDAQVGELYVNAGKTVTAAGTPVIGSAVTAAPDGTTAAGIIVVGTDGLKAGASITVAPKDLTAAFAEVTGSADKQFFHYAEENYSIVCEENKLYLKEGHWHCFCEGAEAKPEGHTCVDVEWTALTQAMFNAPDGVIVSLVDTDGNGSEDAYVLADGGHYYLAEDIILTKTLSPTEGKSFSLCLDGKTLHNTATRTMYFKGTINLCDCDYTDKVEDDEIVRTYAGSVTSELNGHGPVVYSRAKGYFNLYGGNLIGHAISSGSTGGGTIVVDGGENVKDGAMNMYGGRISGGDLTDLSSQNGGNMIMINGASVKMYGGVITGGRVSGGKSGGNIRIDGGSVFDFYDGTISGGWANEGGNIAVSSTGTLNIYDGVIESGTAQSCGGNIMVYGKLIINDGATIKDGVCTGSNGGGNIGCFGNKTDIVINGGTITNGKASKGANITLRTNNTTTIKFTMLGGTVEGVHADSQGVAHSFRVDKSKVEFTIGGDAKIDDLYLCAGAELTESTELPLTEEAKIGISAANDGVFMTASGTINYLKVFSAVNSEKTVSKEETSLKIG